MPRFRLPTLLWRSSLFVAVEWLVSSAGASHVALAQVPPIGATAEVRNGAGRLLATAEFREGRGEVLITLIFPSPPVLAGAHALRITSVGRCDPPDFTSAGEGFNPTDRKHGRQNPDGPQVGDLPNVNFTRSLTTYNTSALGATLGPGATSLLGTARTAIVIYSGEDDQRTDPDGNAGVRIGCGVITPMPGSGAVVPPAAVTTPMSDPVAAPLPAPEPGQAALAGRPLAPTLAVVVSPVSSPGVAASPVGVVSPTVARSDPSPVASLAATAVPTTFLPATAVPTAAPALAPVVTQSSGALGSGPALLIAILGVAFVGTGYLLRRHGQLSR